MTSNRNKKREVMTPEKFTMVNNRMKNYPHVTNFDHEIVIPELEEAACRYQPRQSWTEKEVAVMKKYYGRVPITQLAAYLHRSVNAIHNRAAAFGMTERKKKP